ncbi:ABC-2 type transport system permease protein [Williamsia limnetica]|uniref:Transport permease protein n=1 Tax=Williamsia limnetica TaxID=882452 RepID=A0A318RHI6_WILLI|nr:ABC-2 type transport system permease protein [Williamsia limnetica]
MTTTSAQPSPDDTKQATEKQEKSNKVTTTSMGSEDFLPAKGGGLFSDSSVMAGRNLLTIRRVPTLLVSATVQPFMFVFLFAYVFGATLGGASYREFLMAGIFTQTVVFNSAFTTVGLAQDLQSGIVDRLRTLPMWSLAVVLGRTLSDLLVSIVSVAVMALCGLVIGWRIRGSALDALIALGLILLLAFAMSWVGAFSGLMAPNVEVAQSIGFVWMFPMTFLSSAFISAQSLPGPLKTIAEWNPITAVATASRQLLGNAAPADFPQATGWVADNAVLYSVLTCAAILIVFVPLSLWRYRSVASH